MTAPPLANLINELTKLPGIGGKSAQRLAYYILKHTAVEAETLAAAILDVKSKIFRCSVCNNMTDVEPCAICADPRRDASVICVVEEAFNIPTIEATRDFRGVFHVLLGEMPQEFWFYARFPFDLRRITSAPFFLWHKRPLDRGGAGAFFARHGWQLPNQSSTFCRRAHPFSRRAGGACRTLRA